MSLLEFDRNNRKANVKVFPNCHIWWLLGFKDNKMYVLQNCFSEQDRAEQNKYSDQFDFTVFCPKGEEEAFALAEKLQKLADTGISFEDAVAEYFESLK